MRTSELSPPFTVTLRSGLLWLGDFSRCSRNTISQQIPVQIGAPGVPSPQPQDLEGGLLGCEKRLHPWLPYATLLPWRLPSGSHLTKLDRPVRGLQLHPPDTYLPHREPHVCSWHQQET